MTKDARRYGDWDLYRRLWQEARAYRWHILGLFLLSLLAAPLSLLLPVPVKVVVDHVLGDQPLPAWLAAFVPASWVGGGTQLLTACALAVVVLAVLVQLQDMAAWLWKTWIGKRLVLDFRARLFQHLQRLSLSFHDRRKTADSIYRLQLDAPAIESVAVEGAIPFATAIVKVLVLLAATARLDLLLAGVAVLGGPVLFGLTELFRVKLRNRWTSVQETESSAMTVAQEALGSMRVVKAFGQEERESLRYESRVRAGVEAAMRAVWAHSTFDLLVGVTTGLAAAALLYLGARHVQEGVLTLGELLLVLAYLSQLFAPLREVGTRVASMQRALASAARVLTVLDEPSEIRDPPDARPLGRAQGAFSFRDVTFGYDPARPVIRHVDLEIPAGARVGIAGRTGSGKSTLLSLLPRFYDPTGGAVHLDGVDLRALRLGDLRRQFAIVLQEAVLFSTSIRENIAYGRPDATQAEIEEAARLAAAHDFIAALPAGYDSPVGERGKGLSGGERQRVALARAFLCDAPGPDPRRADQRARRGHRGGGDGRRGAADGGADDVRHRPPPQHPGGLHAEAPDRRRSGGGPPPRGHRARRGGVTTRADQHDLPPTTVESSSPIVGMLRHAAAQGPGGNTVVPGERRGPNAPCPGTRAASSTRRSPSSSSTGSAPRGTGSACCRERCSWTRTRPTGPRSTRSAATANAWLGDRGLARVRLRRRALDPAALRDLGRQGERPRTRPRRPPHPDARLPARGAGRGDVPTPGPPDPAGPGLPAGAGLTYARRESGDPFPPIRRLPGAAVRVPRPPRRPRLGAPGASSRLGSP